MDAQSLLQETGEEIETRTDRLKKKFLDWLKDPYNKIFLAVLIFAIIIRLYYFYITKDQAAWWDAADYLTQAKVFGGLIEFPYRVYAARPFFLALLWGGLLRLGLTEFSFRITELIFSIFGVYGIFLVGKTIFNKKIALISAFLLSVFYLGLFLSFRLMTEIPTLTFFIFAMYFFWEGYMKKKKKMLIWFGVFVGLSVLTRGGSSIMIFIFPLFLIPTEKLKFLKNKYLWASVLMFILVMSTFFGYYYYKEGKNPITHFLALTPETTLGGVSGRFSQIAGISGIGPYINYMPTYFGWTLLIPFVLGISTLLFNLIINFDLILKNKSAKLKKDFFILLWALVPFIFHSVFVRPSVQPRYMIMAFPAFFIILSQGILKISEWVKKYYKPLGVLTIILFLLLGAHYQLNEADDLIKSKVNSYAEVKQAGEWIKANSDPSAIVFSASEPQNLYYSERQTYNPFYLGANKTDFENKIQEMKPIFVVISIFEPYAPEWMFTYPQEHPELLVPVQAYSQNEQPVLIIYQVQYTKEPGVVFSDNVFIGE